MLLRRRVGPGVGRRPGKVQIMSRRLPASSRVPAPDRPALLVLRCHHVQWPRHCQRLRTLQLRRRRIRRGLPHCANSIANPSPVGRAHYTEPKCQPEPNTDIACAHCIAVRGTSLVKPNQFTNVHDDADGITVATADIGTISSAVDIAI